MDDFDAAVLMNRPIEQRSPRNWGIIATAEFMDISHICVYSSREIRICAVCAVAQLGDDAIEWLLSLGALDWPQVEMDIIALLRARRNGAFEW